MPVNYTDFSMDELFNHALPTEDVEAVPESGQSSGLPCLAHPMGGYRIQADGNVDVKKLSDDDRYNPGRIMAHIQASVMQKDGTPLRGKVFFDVSHESRPHPTQPTTKDGKPRFDRAYTLFVQAAKALGVEKENVAAIYQAIAQYPLGAFLTEDFWVLNTTPRQYLRDLKSQDQLTEARNKVQAGEYGTRNTVMSLSKLG